MLSLSPRPPLSYARMASASSVVSDTIIAGIEEVRVSSDSHVLAQF